MTKAERILALAREQVGEPYKFGRSGPDDWDCSGLTLRAARELGYIWKHGATSQWTRGLGIRDSTCRDLPTWVGYWADSGTIDTLPVDKVAFLFNQDMTESKLTMGHTGIYDGNGNVIQAGGQYPGVSDKPINRGRWSHWATLKGADEAMTTGGEVRTIQQQLINLGYDLGVWGVDGKYGPQTTKAVRAFQDDHSLPNTGEWAEADQAAYNALIVQPNPTVKTVTITLPLSAAQALLDALKLQI